MKILSDSKKLLLELLLKDTRISSEILLNGEIPESIKVHDDGSVTFYRSRQHWWSWLFQDKKTYEFRELSTMMLAAYSKYLPPNKYLNNILGDVTGKLGYTENVHISTGGVRHLVP